MDGPRKFDDPRWTEMAYRLFTQFLAVNQQVFHNSSETVNNLREWVFNGYTEGCMGDY